MRLNCTLAVMEEQAPKEPWVSLPLHDKFFVSIIVPPIENRACVL